MKLSMQIFKFVLAGSLGVSLTGCDPLLDRQLGFGQEDVYQNAVRSPLILVNQMAAEQLVQQFQRVSLSATLMVTSIANLDNLEHSSSLGRVIAEHVATRFSRHGYTVLETRLRSHIVVRPGEGELLLTREISDIAQAHQVQAVIVGTYTVARDLVFVTLKVVQPSSNTVLAVHDYALPMDQELRALLTRR